jgi:hypothetical protein
MNWQARPQSPARAVRDRPQSVHMLRGAAGPGSGAQIGRRPSEASSMGGAFSGSDRATILPVRPAVQKSVNQT